MVLNSQQKANLTEKLHIQYLEENLQIKRFDTTGRGFDLISKKHLFELKTRLQIHYGKTPTNNVWWALSQPQIEDYESGGVEDINYLWMFLHALITKPSIELNTKTKLIKGIYHRDVFIAPWEIYKKSPLGNHGKNSKGTGPYRHVSRKNLFNWTNFKQFPLKQGTLYLPRNHSLDYIIKK